MSKPSEPKSLHVAAAQMKFRRTIAENVSVIRGFIESAAELGFDVILFPECALTGYNIDFGKLRSVEIEAGIEAVTTAARQNKIYVLMGAPTCAGEKRYNSLLVIDRKGNVVFRYSKIHLTTRDAVFFTSGNSLAFFEIDQTPCTAIICHERRYPELVRLPVMAGAKILFHANAGLDTLAVSKTKRSGRDGIAVRAFENQIFYVFANSVGPQGNGLWSAGDSKIVAPDMTTLASANNRDEILIHAKVDLTQSGRKYAIEALSQPAFLRAHWKSILATCRKQWRSKLV